MWCRNSRPMLSYTWAYTEHLLRPEESLTAVATLVLWIKLLVLIWSIPATFVRRRSRSARTWNDTCWYIREIGLILVLTAHTKLGSERFSRSTFSEFMLISSFQRCLESINPFTTTLNFSWRYPWFLQNSQYIEFFIIRFSFYYV